MLVTYLFWRQRPVLPMKVLQPPLLLLLHNGINMNYSRALMETARTACDVMCPVLEKSNEIHGSRCYLQIIPPPFLSLYICISFSLYVLLSASICLSLYIYTYICYSLLLSPCSLCLCQSISLSFYLALTLLLCSSLWLSTSVSRRSPDSSSLASIETSPHLHHPNPYWLQWR